MLVDLGAVPTQEFVVLVPAQDNQPAPPQGEEFGEASPIALVVILVLGVVTALLIRNMSKRIKRLPASFDDPAPDEHGPDEHGPDEQASGERAGAREDTEDSGSGRP